MTSLEKRLDSPMPWIGLYVAAASAICSITIVIDAVIGLRRHRVWLPCKYFSLNAFSLTMLAIAMKTIDFTSESFGFIDLLVKMSSLALMIACTSNFMTSLGSMEDIEMVVNIVSLSILVITVAVNSVIHDWILITPPTLIENSVITLMMLSLLGTFCSLAIMMPSAKKYLHLKYKEMHTIILDGDEDWGKYSSDELKILVKKYWIMAATSNPQFVIARSLVSVTSGLVCPFVALILIETYIRFVLSFNGKIVFEPNINYGWSLLWIFGAQCIGIVVGSIAPLFRWAFAARFKSSSIGQRSFRDELKVENYWTSRLVEWRQAPLSLHIRSKNCTKLLNHAKRFVINLCISLQIMFVKMNKLFLLVSALCVRGLLCVVGKDVSGLETRDATIDFSHYALLLEGEPKLTRRTLKNLCIEMDRLIEKSEKNQSKNLISLLHKSSTRFDGVREFNNSQVPRLYSQEPPNCWSLSVATLTSIAVALPNIPINDVDHLLECVTDGLSLVEHVERDLDEDDKLEGVRNAAFEVWEEIRLYKIWQNTDLQSTSLKGDSYKQTLQNLSDDAEKRVIDFTTGLMDYVMQNPRNWPVEIKAASSMYRIAQSLLLAHKDDEQLTDGELFEKLCIMISDLLAACLTNLTRIIMLRCQRNNINEMQGSVRQAVILLGESEEILNFLQQRSRPSLNHLQAASIDEWIAILQQQDNEIHAPSSSAPKMSPTISTKGKECVIELEG